MLVIIMNNYDVCLQYKLSEICKTLDLYHLYDFDTHSLQNCNRVYLGFNICIFSQDLKNLYNKILCILYALVTLKLQF